MTIGSLKTQHYSINILYVWGDFEYFVVTKDYSENVRLLLVVGGFDNVEDGGDSKKDGSSNWLDFGFNFIILGTASTCLA